MSKAVTPGSVFQTEFGGVYVWGDKLTELAELLASCLFPAPPAAPASTLFGDHWPAHVWPWQGDLKPLAQTCTLFRPYAAPRSVAHFRDQYKAGSTGEGE